MSVKRWGYQRLNTFARQEDLFYTAGFFYTVHCPSRVSRRGPCANSNIHLYMWIPLRMLVPEYEYG
jgi:hypothetical protein